MSGKKFVYGKGIEAKIEDGKNISYSLFFDGTQNNKTNTEAKLKGESLRKNIYEQGVKSYNARPNRDSLAAEEPEKSVYNSHIYQGGIIKRIKTAPPRKQKSDSYENDYTNIARLFYSYVETKGIQEEIYIEGVGTEYGAEDA